MTVDGNDLPYGYVEALEVRGDRLHVAGWLARRSGAFDAIVIESASGARHTAEVVDRPDLEQALPQIPRARGAGFVAVVPVAEFAPEPRFEIALLGLERGAVVARRELLHLGPVERSVDPPEHLIRSVQNHPSPALFRTTGLCGAGDVARILARSEGASPVRRVLEFGCGCGRLTAHFPRAFPGAELTGVDADAEMIAWARAHGPRGSYATIARRPPLAAADGAFDLVVAAHVFEDDELAAQSAWAPELARVLAPGGRVLLTTHGRHAAWRIDRSEIDAALDASGTFDGLGDPVLAALVPRPYHCATFQTAAATRAIWAPWFDEVEHVPGAIDCFKDAWVGRKAAR